MLLSTTTCAALAVDPSPLDALRHPTGPATMPASPLVALCRSINITFLFRGKNIQKNTIDAFRLKSYQQEDALKVYENALIWEMSDKL